MGRRREGRCGSGCLRERERERENRGAGRDVGKGRS